MNRRRVGNANHTESRDIAGLDILRGKHRMEGSASCRDWAHAVLALGYAAPADLRHAYLVFFRQGQISGLFSFRRSG
jgi:hypothetical protein